MQRILQNIKLISADTRGEVTVEITPMCPNGLVVPLVYLYIECILSIIHGRRIKCTCIEDNVVM